MPEPAPDTAKALELAYGTIVNFKSGRLRAVKSTQLLIARALIARMEPVEINQRGQRESKAFIWPCPRCSAKLYRVFNFCPHCGKEIKWTN